MSHKQDQPSQLYFNASRNIDFQGPRATSDAGLLRESVYSRLAGCEYMNDAAR